MDRLLLFHAGLSKNLNPRGFLGVTDSVPENVRQQGFCFILFLEVHTVLKFLWFYMIMDLVPTLPVILVCKFYLSTSEWHSYLLLPNAPTLIPFSQLSSRSRRGTMKNIYAAHCIKRSTLSFQPFIHSFIPIHTQRYASIRGHFIWLQTSQGKVLYLMYTSFKRL